MSISPYDFMNENAPNNVFARGSTTLAGNTDENAPRVLVDWVSASFEVATNLQKVLTLLGFDFGEKDKPIFTERKGSRYEMAGYNRTFTMGRIELHQHKTYRKWLINLSGEGCRQYETITEKNIIDLLDKLRHLQATFNRIDIAIDDFDRIYTTNHIRTAVFKKRCVTKLRDWGNNTKGKINGGKDSLTMDSFYLGSRDSRYFLNIYDKKLERQQKNKKEEIEGIDNWTRTEIRFSYEYAEMFVLHVLHEPDKLGEHIREFLNDKFTFLTPSAMKKDENKSRLAKDKKNVSRWWRKFLGEVGKLQISTDKPERTLADTIFWHERQVSTSLAQIAMYKPDEFDEYVEELKKQGFEKMQPKHENLVKTQIYLDSLNKNTEGKTTLIKNKIQKKEPGERFKE